MFILLAELRLPYLDSSHHPLLIYPDEGILPELERYLAPERQEVAA